MLNKINEIAVFLPLAGIPLGFLWFHIENLYENYRQSKKENNSGV